MLTIDWPLTIVVAVGLAVLVGVVGGYLSARLAVIGSERRLNQSLGQSVARSLTQSVTPSMSPPVMQRSADV